MQTIIGRITANALVSKTKNGREVVNFTIAQNDRFKPKGSEEVKQITTYYDCSYWMGTGIAPHLTKGTLVEVTGRVGVNAWQSASGEAKANVTLHVQHIQLHGKAGGTAAASSTSTKKEKQAESDDLPF